MTEGGHVSSMMGWGQHSEYGSYVVEKCSWRTVSRSRRRAAPYNTAEPEYGTNRILHRIYIPTHSVNFTLNPCLVYDISSQPPRALFHSSLSSSLVSCLVSSGFISGLYLSINLSASPIVPAAQARSTRLRSAD